MPVYKDEKRNTWFCKCNYKDWLGESKSKMKRGFATKKDAQQWERDFLQKQSASMDMKFASFVEVYFEDKAPRLKDRSIMTKRTLFETKIIPYFGEKQMNEITAVDIIKWQNALLNQDYKPTYLRMIQNQMTALFNHAEKLYDLKDNPCKKVDKMGRPNAKELNFWTKDEYEQFIQGFSSDEEMYRIIFQMLFWLGCRVGELLALTSEDIDFENGTVNISKTYYRRNQTDYITPPKTESSNRKITIPKFLAEEMKDFVDRQYGLTPEDRIFPITDRAIQKKMKQKTEQAKLKPIRVHDLRHSHIALLIEKGMQPLVIAQRVGHDSVNTTMNIYGHLYPNKQKQVADLLNAEATGGTGKQSGGYGNRDAVSKGRWLVMRMIRGFYNEQNNTVNVIHYDTNCIISLDCGMWESGLRTTPNAQGKMDALAIDDPVEYVRLMLSGEMQVWLDALDNCSVW